MVRGRLPIIYLLGAASVARWLTVDRAWTPERSGEVESIRMNGTTLPLATAFLVLHLVAGCTTGRVGSTSVGDEILVSQSLSGEECRITKTREASEDRPIEAFDVHCGAWESPTGFIWRIKDVDGATFPMLISDQLSPIWNAEALTCGPVGETSVLNEMPALVRDCTDEGGWPNVVVAVRSGETEEAYVGTGLVHFVPVMEAAVAAFTGRDPDAVVKRAGTRSRLLVLAESEIDFGGKVLTLGDVQSYRELTKLGVLYNHSGDFANAERAHRSALAIQEEFLGRDNPRLGMTLASIGLNESNLGHRDIAERAFARAEPLVAQSVPRHLQQHLAYKGLYLARHGDLPAALDALKQSIDLRQELYGPLSPQAAYGYYLQGGAFAQAGDYEAAAERFLQAVTIFETIGDPVWTGFALEWLADAERKLGDFSLAREHASRAVDMIELTFGEGTRLTEALSKLALVERDSLRIEEALETFERAIEIAVNDRITARYLKIDDVAPYLDLLLEQAERRPESAAELYKKAFAAAQAPQDKTTGRAVSLMAARLADSDPAVRDVVRRLQDAIERRHEVGIALGREQLKDEGERDTTREMELAGEITAAASEVAALERQLMIEFPRYGSLIAPAVLEPEALAAQLAPGEALVQLLVTDEATFVFLLRDDGTLRARKSPVTAEGMDDAVTALRATLDLTQATFEAFDPQASFALYQTIFGDLDDDLDPVRHLIVVPSGPLLSLPPAVLVREAPDGRSEVAWLVRDMAVSVLPSIGSLQKLRSVARTSAAPYAFLGIGDPTFLPAPAGDVRSVWSVAGECREDDVVDPLVLRGMQPLPETRNELKAIAGILDASEGSFLLGPRASEANVTAAPLDQYRTIAFATHGLLPAELPCQGEPALILTPPETSSRRDDGLLDASEVAQLRLDADWVVLSACNTAGPAGQLGGESLSGLARAFFYAGARSLLVTHWPVDSDAAVALTTGTFGQYAGGAGGKAEALRRAQLELLADPFYNHPAFWAAFTLVGDGSDGPEAVVSAASRS
jgi:CHAT domain-containing protein